MSASVLKDDQILELKGDWDFFWNSWIEPGDERPAPEKYPAGRAWLSRPGTEGKIGQGYATYRLILTDLQPRMDGYSLAIRNASAAMRVILYPRNKPHEARVASAGRLGLNAAEEVPQLRLSMLRFFPDADETEWVVLVQISNFHYSRGGLWTAPLLSLGDFAQSRMSEDRELLLFCLGMITVIGVYNIVLFIRRPTDKPTLMLALFCAVVCLRSTASDNLISWYYPVLQKDMYALKYLIEYGTMVLGPLACISFIHFTFPGASQPRFYRFVVNLSLMAGLIILTLDAYYRSQVLIPLQLVTLTQILFGLTVVVRAVVQSHKEALLAAIGCFVLSGCVIHDILVTFNIASQPYLTSLGMSAFVFMQSQVVAQRFAKAFLVAEHLSVKLQDEVERQTLELRSIMENIPQGVFIMLADQSIQGNYSKELEQLLGERQLTGRPALPILFRNARITDEDRSIIDSILVSSFHEPLFVWELNQPNLPHEFVRETGVGAQEIFAVEWHPIVSREQLVDRVLVTLRNVTELRGLQASQRKDQEAFSLLLEIVQVSPERFRDFMKQSQEILERAEFDAKDKDARLRQRKVLMRLHTWKGLARGLQFKTLAAHIHDVEHILGQDQTEDSGAMLATLRPLWSSLHAYESVCVERLGRLEGQETVFSLSHEARRLVQVWYQYHHKTDATQRLMLDKAVEAFVKSLPDITCGQLLDSLEPELENLAQDLQKPKPRLERQGVLDQPLPEPLFRGLGYALQHLLRNSMDHGLEAAGEREAKGKDPRGRILIRFSIENGSLLMDYQDDGRGLDLDRVQKKADELGMTKHQKTRNPHELAQLIFAPGFSTKGEASMISGRGIGMDAVRLLVEESSGEIALILDHPTLRLQTFHLRASWSLDTLLNLVA